VQSRCTAELVMSTLFSMTREMILVITLGCMRNVAHPLASTNHHLVTQQVNYFIVKYIQLVTLDSEHHRKLYVHRTSPKTLCPSGGKWMGGSISIGFREDPFSTGQWLLHFRYNMVQAG